MSRSRPLSLAGMRAFLAAARHLSFTLAAAELHLSQPALSRQVQGLERELGVPLFVRSTRKLALTAAGEALRRAATSGLAQIDECVARLRAGRDRRQVVVSTFASFASLWLIPRLATFSQAHRDVDVHCLASDRRVDLEGEGVDVALRCTRAELARRSESAGEVVHYLFPERTVPVSSPALAAAAEPPLREPADLRRHVLLAHPEDEDELFPWLAWTHWFGSLGLGAPRARAMLRFTNHDQVVQAALAGQGVALGRGALVAHLLEEGRLAAPLGSGLEVPFAYYAVTTRAALARPEVGAFVDWVLREATASASSRPSAFEGRGARARSARRRPAPRAR